MLLKKVTAWNKYFAISQKITVFPTKLSDDLNYPVD